MSMAGDPYWNNWLRMHREYQSVRYQYHSRGGFALAAQYVERTGLAEMHQLDQRERQGLADPYTARHSKALAMALIQKAQREG